MVEGPESRYYVEQKDTGLGSRGMHEDAIVDEGS
jgi:hypothetical protein